MLLFSTPAVLITLIALVAMSALCAFLRNNTASKILSYVNIALHIALLAPLLIYGFSFEEAVMIYMISLTFYTLFGYVRYEMDKRAARGDEACDEEGGV